MEHTVRATFAYDPATGQFTRKQSQKASFIGKPTGGPNGKGYVILRFMHDGRFKTRLAHRVAFLLMEGRWPEGVIDHINGDPADNRWVNLRHVTAAENHVNTGQPTQYRNVVRLNGRYYPIVGAGYICPHEAALAAEVL